MYDGDQANAAFAQASTLSDDRITHGWDGDKTISNLFSQTLALTRTAWDIYLVYAPGVVWHETAPPVPTFWMHQLTADSGADQQLCLNPQQIKSAVADLLGKNI